MAEIIVKYNGDVFTAAERVGADVELLSENYAILQIDNSNIPMLYSFTEIEDIELPKRLYFESDFQLTSSCIKSVQQGESSFPSDIAGLRGRGVAVAVIDSGVDFTHPDFIDNDGNTRLLYLWDQSLDGAPPEGFRVGTEFTGNQINLALGSDDPFSVVPSRDFAGHGTAVAGIACGNGRASDGEILGAAPEASIIAVRVGSKESDFFALSTDIMRAVKYVINKAVQMLMPVVINLSFGMNSGAHDGNSLFEEYLTDMASKWKSVIVVPTGNEGSSGHHYSDVLVTSQIKEIEFFTAEGLESLYLSLWKNFADSFAVELIFPDGRTSGIVDIENPLRTVNDGATQINILYEQPTRYSVSQEIYIDIKALSGTIKSGVWRLRIIPSVIVDGRINIWLPTTEQVTNATYFSQPTVSNTITLPATARKVIRVAGYNDRLGSIAPFSGVGDIDREDIIPDIAAPAVNILSTRTGGGYSIFTGTSFASPFVTGSAALMLEWGIVRGNAPFLYGERIRAYLRLGASRSPDLRYPNPTFGYGRLCLSSSLTYLQLYMNGSSE